MNKITLDGKKDHLFTDDRDARVEQMAAKDRVPSYGRNNLYAPTRSLTREEAELLNRVGMPAGPDSELQE
jgi:hypothetical protein